MKETISVSTFTDLKEVGYALALYCLPCDRWHQFDVDGAITSGRGNETYVGRKFVCNECGNPANVQVQQAQPGPAAVHNSISS